MAALGDYVSIEAQHATVLAGWLLGSTHACTNTAWCACPQVTVEEYDKLLAGGGYYQCPVYTNMQVRCGGQHGGGLRVVPWSLLAQGFQLVGIC